MGSKSIKTLLGERASIIYQTLQEPFDLRGYQVNLLHLPHTHLIRDLRN